MQMVLYQGKVIVICLAEAKQWIYFYITLDSAQKGHLATRPAGVMLNS